MNSVWAIFALAVCGYVPDGTFTTTKYDLAGQVTETTDEKGNVTKYRYDLAGRRTEVEDSLGKVTVFTYDKNGNQKTVTDANQHVTTYEYDANNRRVKTIFHDQTFTTTEYDKLGRRTAEGDQAGKRTEFVYDKLGRLTEVKDAASQVTRYGYNEVGQQLTQVDALSRTTAYEYDRLGRRVKRTLPLGQIETYGYDFGGNLLTRTDFNGRMTEYRYNSLNQLTRKIPDASFAAPDVMFTYTATGQRATMTDASGVTTWHYDLRERLESKETPNGTLTYSYEDAGNIASVTSSNGGVNTTYTYDALNRCATVNGSGGITTYNYDDVGNLASCLYPNGVQTTWNYNALNRLTNVASARAGTAIASYGYTLGPAGNRTAVAEVSGRTVAYGYDTLYRLTRETITGVAQGGVIGYEYDPVGNRLSRTSTVAAVPPQAATFDANDRLGSDQYDPNGNTTGSDGTVYVYDFENRIKSVTKPDGTFISIVYDGDGNRGAKTVNGVTTTYLVDTNNLTGYAQVVEELQDGNVVCAYTYGLDLICQTRAGATSHYGYDGHGSVRYLTDITGNVSDTYDYDAFGILIGRTGTTPNVYLYAGEQWDDDLGMYYNRARYLQPATGRFWTMDDNEGNTWEPASLHKYLYANNTPVTAIDPSGRFTLLEMMTVGAIIGGIVGMSVGAYIGYKQTGEFLNLTTLKYAAIGLVVGAAAGALIGGSVYGFVHFGGGMMMQIFRRGLSEFLRKIAWPHSRTAIVMLHGYVTGFIVGYAYPDAAVQAAASITALLTVLNDFLVRGAYRNSRIIDKDLMTAFQLYAATSLYYYQGVTFFAAHFMIGFAGGYSLGSLARTGMREMGLDD